VPKLQNELNELFEVTPPKNYCSTFLSSRPPKHRGFS